jgi:far upstream element-binding protein
MPIPNECVGLIIGKGGETIRTLQQKSGCKVQVAKKEIPNTDLRNVFVEGPPEKLEAARLLIQKIVSDHREIQERFYQLGVGDINPFPGPHHMMPLPDEYTAAIIGFEGQTIK